MGFGRSIHQQPPCSRNAYIEKPSICFDLCLCRAPKIGNRAFVYMQYRYRIEFTPLTRMHCHELDCLIRISK